MIYLDHEAVLALASPTETIGAIERAFLDPGPLPARLHYDLPGQDRAKLLIMPAWRGRSAIGVKIATVMPENPARGRPTIDGGYVLLDGSTGRMRALLDAAALTAVRTAAVSALAGRHMLRSPPRTLLMVGTGALIPHLARAHASVHEFETVLVWGRDRDKAEQMAGRLQALASIVRSVERLDEAMPEADIISVATASRAPFISGDWVQPGTHIDLVGSFTPDMREVDSDLFTKAQLVVDTPSALEESGDLIEPLRQGVLDPAHIVTLTDLLRTPLKRPADDAITIFKSVGTGLSDLAVAERLDALWREQKAAAH